MYEINRLATVYVTLIKSRSSKTNRCFNSIHKHKESAASSRLANEWIIVVMRSLHNRGILSEKTPELANPTSPILTQLMTLCSLGMQIRGLRSSNYCDLKMLRT